MQTGKQCMLLVFVSTSGLKTEESGSQTHLQVPWSTHMDDKPQPSHSKTNPFLHLV